MTREALALDVHVIAAQFAEGMGHKFSGDALRGSYEIGVVKAWRCERRAQLQRWFRIQGTPSRNFEAPSATSGRDAAEPTTIRASSTTP
jgi:hypothetical protein